MVLMETITLNTSDHLSPVFTPWGNRITPQILLFVSPSACKSANIDLVFLIDGSKSVRPQNFELVKKFVNQVGGA